jgi:hypothetical protein
MDDCRGDQLSLSNALQVPNKKVFTQDRRFLRLEA